MYRVIYSSRATRFFSHQGIEALKVTCRRNNAEKGLTGILVFHEGRFFQVLEGEDDVLLEMMQVIGKDQRHTALQLSEHGVIEKRAFQTWRMGYDMPDTLPAPPAATFQLRDLLPRDSRYRGHDPEVRNHVRHFLSSLRNLPQAAAG
ncbi:hypothetical protein HKCCE4037_10865 [Rhodobacterales bacterium HKCCE4037]|nr:hypothetical protein [Rhodobacterales bacterium HKCCE4037]